MRQNRKKEKHSEGFCLCSLLLRAFDRDFELDGDGAHEGALGGLMHMLLLVTYCTR